MMDGVEHKNPPAATIIITLMPAHSINPLFSQRKPSDYIQNNPATVY
jgi:hypothetical protein